VKSAYSLFTKLGGRVIRLLENIAASFGVEDGAIYTFAVVVILENTAFYF